MLLKRTSALWISSIVLCLVLIQGCTSMPDPGPITLTLNRVSTQATASISTALPYTATRPPATPSYRPNTAAPITATYTPSHTPTTGVETLTAVRRFSLETRAAQTATLLPFQTNTPEQWQPTYTLAPLPIDMATPTDAASDVALSPVKQNRDWTSVEREFDGVAMVLVPIGCFMMGGESGFVGTLPVHQQCIEWPFWIDKYEVTNEQFERFGGVGAYDGSEKDPQRPRESVIWEIARDFCELRGGRLPTEKQWEYAARGPSSLIYPWGNEWDPDRLVQSETLNNQSATVGSYPTGASWVGAQDMAGNVAEWTSSKNELYPYNATDGREELIDRPDPSNPDAPYRSLRIIRGGAFDVSESASFMTYFRIASGGTNPMPVNGVRCVRGFGQP